MENHGERGARERWEPLAPGIARRRMPVWDCTIGAVAGPSGVLLVDTGSSLREGAEIRREVEELFGRRVTHIALTHAHFDHVLGTAAFAGVQVYGAMGIDVALRDGEEVRTSAVRQGVDADAAEEAADLLVRPHHLVSGELTLDLGGGRRVLLADVGPGHTGHDLVVLVTDSGGAPEVVFCGDLVEESGEPQAGGDAYPAQWPAALDALLALGGEDAIYVPGHGAVVDAGFVRAQRDALALRFGVS
ncbi:MBL fold metallo-hydrolase [Streptomyces netropsis]|uniref:Glyoxylase-like metal-dependent hydrolase (Beta-lactamase superfamily II) n=1 Tax=Streptomyces netropsis TaxID=55404 RepID=A0A7W7L658_STRNE|nr:MBL fold metallo-hydrolase [Streptomyces netropsis]MBB4884318.1 glyoxylase-like metal-dependent hydrolase (beta-lactamase superfamily II) [Streptomyces netropsis]GGR04536.1 MBL fold hydrolase [Streptomyces netropsis]